MAGLTVTVKPASKRPGFAYEAETWVLRVRERAIEGAANDACIRAIAAALCIAPSQLELLRGHRGRIKTFGVRGLSASEVEGRLRILREGSP